MKRIFLLLMILAISISSQAQIQRSFMGCTFGSTKQFILQKMKAKGYIVTNKTDGFYVSGSKNRPIRFGGYSWEEIQITFYKNKFYSILFVNSSKTLSKASVYEFYQLSKDKLDAKYHKYANEQFDPGLFCWSDDETMVVDRYTNVNINGCAVSKYDSSSLGTVWVLSYEDLKSSKRKDEDAEL